MKENELIDKKTTYFFVRHGQTDWNVQGKVQGHTDIPLNEIGKQQARVLKKMLEETHFSACISSDMQRAVETASIVIEEYSLDVVKDSTLRTTHYGAFEGASWEEFNKMTPEQRAFIEQEQDERIKKFLIDKAQDVSQGNTLVVTHGSVMCRLLIIVLNLPVACAGGVGIDNAGGISIENTAYVQMYFSGSEWVIEKTEGITLPEIKEHL